MSGRLFVTGGQVVRPDGVRRATLVVEDGRILDADYRGEVPAGAQVLDARDRYVLPGLVEIHAHGGGGCDFMDATREAFETVVCTHMRHGATTILPTTVACEAEEMRELFELYRRMRQGRLGNALGGVHLEGPFISQAMRGAQNPAHIRAPQTAEVDALMDEAGDLIRLITAAPQCQINCISCKFIVLGIRKPVKPNTDTDGHCHLIPDIYRLDLIQKIKLVFS